MDLKVLRFLASSLAIAISAGAASADDTPIPTGTWKLLKVAGYPVFEKSAEFARDPLPYIRIGLAGDGQYRVYGYSGCNRFGGLIVEEPDQASLAVIADASHCGEDIALQELNIFAILTGTPRFSVDNNRLVVTGEDDRTLIAETAENGAGSIAGFWRVSSINGKILDINEPVGRYPILVEIDDTVIGASSQCIAFRWSYEMTGEAISTVGTPHLGPDGKPLPMCARGLSDVEKQFGDVFDDVSSYYFGDTGELVFASPRGTLTLVRR